MYLYFLLILSINASKINDWIQSLTKNNMSLQNKTKIQLSNDRIEGLIQTSDRIKITFTSKKPFALKIYTTSGIILKYKASKVSYTGYPTYYEIKNIDNTASKITLDIYKIGTDWFKLLFTMLAICAIFVLIFYKREHRISQIFLFILLAIDLIKQTDYDKTADRIFHKLLY